MREVGMVIGSRADVDHGTILTRDFWRIQMQSDKGCGSISIFSFSKHRVLCTPVPANPHVCVLVLFLWSGVDVVLM
jgi:hypothetical protein